MSVGTLFVLFVLAVSTLGAQSFSTTGSMNQARANYTATLLGNGAVLATGGDITSSSQTNTAEVYDPNTGLWRYTKFPMNVARSQHTATLLLDGRVLIVGGGNPGALSSTEIFDPTTEQFALTGSMSVQRSSSQTVLLDDGRVMAISGRCDNCGGFVTNTVEIYAPSLGTWSLAAPLPIAVSGHAAVVLPSGKVLVTGGYDGDTSNTYAAVYLYDPTGDDWQSMTPMTATRKGHTATRLTDGRVLIAAGGPSTSAPYNTTEIYDPTAGSTGTTQMGPPLNTDRVNHTATLLWDGRILVAGGQNGCYLCPANVLESAELLDAGLTGPWTLAGSMSNQRVGHTATSLAPLQRVLVAGGDNTVGLAWSSADLWGGPVAGTVSVTTNLATANFTIAGPTNYSGSGTSFTQTNAAVGTYTVTYGAVAGYVTPATQSLILSAGGTISFSGNYQASPLYFGAPGPTHPDGGVAEPVDTATGNYYTSHVDLSVPGKGLSFSFVRYYNALSGSAGPIGAGWSHSFNIILSQLGSGVVNIQEADGHSESFTPIGAGTYAPSTPGVFDDLKENSNGSFTLTQTNQTQLNFSSGGQLLTIVDRNGNAQTLAYSGTNLTSITDSSGRVFLFSYDGSNRVVALTDPAARSIHYSYDASGNLASVQDALGGVTQYAYDANHRMVTGTDPRGTIYLQNTYDAAGRVVIQKNALGFATAFTYDTPSPGVTTITDPLTNITQHVHDSGLRLVQVINALGGTTSYTYGANNLKLSTTDPLGRAQAFAYDGNGNLTAATDPTGKTTQFAYNSTNDLLQITDRLGRVTRFNYDSRGNLLSTVDPAGDDTVFTYTSAGQVAAAKNARNFTTSFTYDTAGNLTKITDALAGTVQTTYDAVGRLLTVKNQIGQTTTRAYDADNRLISIKDPLGNATQFGYDGNGNLTQLTDASGKVTHYAFDATNKLMRVTDAIGGVTDYVYNGNTDLVSVTNANGHTTTYAYDPLRRLASTTDPLARRKHYGYDAVGNVTSTLDGNFKTNNFAYDLLSRLTSMALSDGKNVAYTYDAVGNRLTMTDWRGLSTYGYDVLNRVLSVATPDGKTVAYAYDNIGDRVKLTYPDGKSLQYQYDALNRLSKVTDWANKSTNYAFDPASNLTLTTQPNGTSSLYAYDPASRLVGITNLSGFLPLSGFAYTLDKVGNRTAVLSSAGGLDQYGYVMVLYRLTSWTNLVGQVARYNFYDAVGNRVSLVAPTGTTTYAYDAADELLKAGTTTFTYDGNGSQLTKASSAVTVNYGWDALNRLITVAGGSVKTEYQYDGDGNRVHQQVGANAYQYTNDTATPLRVVLSENGPDGNIDYVFGESLVSATSPTFQSFYQFDGLGSVTSVTNQTGGLAANYAYDPWGQPITPVLPPFGLDTLGTKNKYKFGGQALDPNDSLLFLRARYYDSSVGRFLNRDPSPGALVNPLTINKYEYALSDPLRYSDPSGLSAEESTPATADSTPESLLTLDNLSKPPALSSIGAACGSPDVVGGLISSIPVVGFGYGLYKDLKDPAIRNNVPLLIGRQSIDLLIEVVSDASVVGTVGKVALDAYNLVSSACPKATDQAVNQLLGAH